MNFPDRRRLRYTAAADRRPSILGSCIWQTLLDPIVSDFETASRPDFIGTAGSTNQI